MEPPLVYNLFPRLVGHMGQWPAHGRRARQMGFDWIFVNPVQYPGFSGSLYAVKDYYRLNPLFVPPHTDDAFAALRRTVDQLHELGLKVCLDLVINHTARDCDLVRERPTWYRLDEQGEVISPSAIDPADTRKVTVWGDLAEIDNEGSRDREGLWGYWVQMSRHYLELGFDGFRCDAAYKVPAPLWDQLIGSARARFPEVAFWAETLGCRLDEVRRLKDAGFDYLFNSSKWWNFDAPWCLEQHRDFGQIAPSIAFPESHDTPRLMRETDGLEQVQRQRYLLAAIFSAGLLMPVGFEYGFTRKLDVVHTAPEDWEETDTDLTGFITEVNAIKRADPTLNSEGRWELLTTYDAPTIVLLKTSNAGDPVVVAINKDWRAAQSCRLPDLGAVCPGPLRAARPCVGGTPVQVPGQATLQLEPAEIVLLSRS